MGCDIHMMAKVQQDNGSWKNAGEIDGNRNYDLFAILANVRNGHGFAGIKTGGGIRPDQ